MVEQEIQIEEANQEEVIDQMAELEKTPNKDDIKIFGLYGVEGIEVQDPGLKRVISIQPKLVLKSHGRIKGKYSGSKVNIVEKLIRLLCHPGHRGKKHKIMTRTTGKFNKATKIVLDAFKIIEQRTKKNPIGVFVKAVENASPREEVTTIEYGGAKYPQAVDTSPLRRVGLTIRLIVHGAYDKAFNKKTKIEEALANEIVLASEENKDSFALQKKVEAEKQANSAR